VGGAIGGPKLEGEVVRDGAAATSPTVGGETRGAGGRQTIGGHAHRLMHDVLAGSLYM
jgi:hypothetical protein